MVLPLQPSADGVLTFRVNTAQVHVNKDDTLTPTGEWGGEMLVATMNGHGIAIWDDPDGSTGLINRTYFDPVTGESLGVLPVIPDGITRFLTDGTNVTYGPPPPTIAEQEAQRTAEAAADLQQQRAYLKRDFFAEGLGTDFRRAAAAGQRALKGTKDGILYVAQVSTFGLGYDEPREPEFYMTTPPDGSYRFAPRSSVQGVGIQLSIPLEAGDGAGTLGVFAQGKPTGGGYLYQPFLGLSGTPDPAALATATGNLTAPQRGIVTKPGVFTPRSFTVDTPRRPGFGFQIFNESSHQSFTEPGFDFSIRPHPVAGATFSGKGDISVEVGLATPGASVSYGVNLPFGETRYVSGAAAEEQMRMLQYMMARPPGGM